MSMRSLHVVHLLIRQNLPDGRSGFLVYPHEHWKAPDGEPYLALPAKKTVNEPLAEFVLGSSLNDYIDEIALKEWELPAGAYNLHQQFAAADWTVPSPGRKDEDFRPLPTRYTVYPVEVWLAPEHREPLRYRLQGRWLTADDALAEPWLSPTARGVFAELRKRHEHFKTNPPDPEEKHPVQEAEALCRLFGPVSDRPMNTPERSAKGLHS
jgi:hypothetical protein